MDVTIKAAPGLWIHIMGILRAPTSFVRYVCKIWGAYCIADRMADVTPRKVAQT
jgi:hypothetical protein